MLAAIRHHSSPSSARAAPTLPLRKRPVRGQSCKLLVFHVRSDQSEAAALTSHSCETQPGEHTAGSSTILMESSSQPHIVQVYPSTGKEMAVDDFLETCPAIGYRVHSWVFEMDLSVYEKYLIYSM